MIFAIALVVLSKLPSASPLRFLSASDLHLRSFKGAVDAGRKASDLLLLEENEFQRDAYVLRKYRSALKGGSGPSHDFAVLNAASLVGYRGLWRRVGDPITELRYLKSHSTDYEVVRAKWMADFDAVGATKERIDLGELLAERDPDDPLLQIALANFHGMRIGGDHGKALAHVAAARRLRGDTEPSVWGVLVNVQFTDAVTGSKSPKSAREAVTAANRYLSLVGEPPKGDPYGVSRLRRMRAARDYLIKHFKLAE